MCDMHHEVEVEFMIHLVHNISHVVLKAFLRVIQNKKRQSLQGEYAERNMQEAEISNTNLFCAIFGTSFGPAPMGMARPLKTDCVCTFVQLIMHIVSLFVI